MNQREEPNISNYVIYVLASIMNQREEPNISNYVIYVVNFNATHSVGLKCMNPVVCYEFVEVVS
jgi:hypothetical protein